ncbi:unnamed protein product [Orchesella dallaii]|uniref:Uncharacterized protein n=1 Tax=Orchesella dallaii TaxID=48710 RepID=A0ABP1RUM1_9HEXA
MALFFGLTASVLLKCDQKLSSYSHIDSQYFKFIAGALKSALRRRFERIMSLNVETARSEILARISLPCFKLPWVPMEFFIDAADLWRRKQSQSHVSGSEPSLNMNLEIVDDLFDFDISVQSVGTMNVGAGALKYLQSVKLL